MEYLPNTTPSISNYPLHNVYIKSTTYLEDLEELTSNAKNHTPPLSNHHSPNSTDNDQYNMKYLLISIPSTLNYL